MEIIGVRADITLEIFNAWLEEEYPEVFQDLCTNPKYIPLQTPRPASVMLIWSAWTIKNFYPKVYNEFVTTFNRDTNTDFECILKACQSINRMYMKD